MAATVVDLETLDGSAGFTMTGRANGDQFGSSVSNLGDVNGDGIDDFIVGARYADPGGDSNAGEAYVVFGQAGSFGAEFALADLDGSNGFRIDGINSTDNIGSAVSSAGDFNGDGVNDILLGARGADTGVLFGPACCLATASPTFYSDQTPRLPPSSI